VADGTLNWVLPANGLKLRGSLEPGAADMGSLPERQNARLIQINIIGAPGW
jgi:hypothetical protein